jgi:D-beta-D-heptose 7-phosphate kinase/D-beta-D-heptose 1-phosphate adenosyltransferase
LVVGDILLDTYLWSKPNRVSPEAPVIIMDVEREEHRLGGAGNVAVNLKALGCKPLLVGILGKGPAGNQVFDLMRQNKLDLENIYVIDTPPTLVKTRVMAHKQQVVRLDWGGHYDYSNECQDFIIKTCDLYMKKGIDAVIISDYGKGVLNQHVLSEIITWARARHIPTCVDPKRINYNYYQYASLITPNISEASEMSGVQIVDEETMKHAARNIIDSLHINTCLITQGETGMSLFKKEWPYDKYVHIPAWKKENVFDVTGAGDTVISVIAACLAPGANVVNAAKIANAAAGLVVQVVGCGAVTIKDLMAQVSKIR